MVSAWIALLGMSAVDSIVLERGAVVDGQRYVAVEDTCLDLTRPDEPLGGNSILESGGGKAVLIQFRELKATLGNKRVKSAQLEFTIGRGNPVLSTVRRMLVPWTEGPINSISGQIRGDATGGRWAATQRNRRAGADPIPWQSTGARGDLDAERVTTVAGERKGDVFVISGLAAAIQTQIDRPTLNHGFRIDFEDQVEFMSSESTEGRPRLVLELEDAPAKASGPDLAVVLIERTPEYERYDTRGQAESGSQDDVQVPATFKAANGDGKRWPDDGEEVTYRAVVKNVGTAAAEPFEGQWFVRELPNALIGYNKPLAPGESATFEIKTQFRSSHTDHRLQPVSLRLFAKPNDLDGGNDELEVQQAALTLGFTVTPAAVESWKQKGIAYEVAIQRAVHRWNEVLSRYSRFSFAPAGSLERVRAQSIVIGTESPVNLKNDGDILVGPDTNLDQAIARACGLVDLTPAGLQSGSLTADGFAIPPSPDRFPGVLGGGETRSDALLAPSFAFPHERFVDVFADPEKHAVGAGLSATDVYALNRNLGRRRGFTGDYLYDVPGSVLVTFVDPSGKRLANQEFSVYAMRSGSFSGAKKLESLKTGDSGSMLLPKRETGVAAGSYTPTGHQLLANPFGRVATDGSNGALAFRTVVNGVEAVGVLKLWQVLDSVARSRQPLALVTVQMHVPATPLGERVALGAGAAKTDDGKPVDGLVDGDPATGLDLSTDAVTIDLGREFTLGEVTVSWAAGGAGGFDILGYRPGEKADSARLFAREGDASWSARVRGTTANGTTTLGYYGMAMKARYLRIVRRPGSANLKLTDVRVIPGK